MKKIITSISLVMLTISISSFAEDSDRVVPVVNMKKIEQYGSHRTQTTIDDRFGQKSRTAIPCPCIFDRGREIKRTSLDALGYVWVCKVSDQYGLCREIERIDIGTKKYNE